MLWMLAVALAGLAAFLGMRAADMRDERPRLEARLERLETQAAPSAARSSPPPSEELHALRERVRALNKLSGLRGWSTPQLLGWLGARLPDNVYLVSLHHKPRDGEALLVAESASAEALTTFLLRLEKEPGFAEVLLSKQGRSGSSGDVVQFEIRVRWNS
jgi:hypothetical protein